MKVNASPLRAWNRYRHFAWSLFYSAICDKINKIRFKWYPLLKTAIEFIFFCTSGTLLVFSSSTYKKSRDYHYVMCSHLIIAKSDSIVPISSLLTAVTGLQAVAPELVTHLHLQLVAMTYQLITWWWLHDGSANAVRCNQTKYNKRKSQVKEKFKTWKFESSKFTIPDGPLKCLTDINLLARLNIFLPLKIFLEIWNNIPEHVYIQRLNFTQWDSRMSTLFPIWLDQLGFFL